jgi:repressor LexA
MEIFHYLRSFIDSHGYPPTVREIGSDFGMKSPSTIYFHLKKLAEAGLIDMPPGKTRAITLLQDPDPHRNQIPVLGDVTVSDPILAEDNIVDYIPYHGPGEAEDHFALRVQGDSMRGAGILPGDLVVVHCQQEAESGQVVVALLEDGTTVKTLSINDGKVWLLPQNPAFHPIDGTNARIVGQVIQLVRQY